MSLCYILLIMKDTVYVFGHKNPDTDSVVSATAFARLKNLQGESQYKAARAGKLNPQTEYIYKKFGITPPDFIPDLNPKVSYYMTDKVDMVNQMNSFWEATSFMKRTGRRVLPVVDDQCHYKAILNYNSFSKNIFEILNPEHHISVFSDVNLMASTLNGKILNRGINADELHKYTIVSGASSFQSFEQTIENHNHGGIVVITGDRDDIQRLCIEKKVAVIILSGGRTPSEEIIKLAKENNTTIIVSKYDTASASMLILYSTPVRMVCDHSIKPIKADDPIQKILPLLKDNGDQTLPVVDVEGKVIGILSEIDIHHEPKIKVALVDHNELTQAVDGIENYKITDIIDHHRLGAISTKTPISFINMPLGSTATIVTKIYREQNVEIPLDVAKLLLCGILSDTLILKSATTTQVDIEIASFLSKLTGLNLEELGEEIIKAGSRISGRTSYEVINQDMKEYKEGGDIFTVSQIEVDGTGEVIARKNEFLDDLEIARRSYGALFSALLVTDISTLSSVMLVASEAKFLPALNFPKQDDHVYFLKNVVSRKKQLIPMLSEILASYGG